MHTLPIAKRTAAQHLLRGFLIFYFVFSLPIIIVFLKSEYVRYITFQTVANWRAKIASPVYIFCGDSITAGGRSWDMRLGWNPFTSLNFASNGYTVFQVRNEVERALKYHPKYIFIMAGTNDVLSHRTAVEQSAKDFEDMLMLFAGSDIHPVITLIPLTAGAEDNDAIDAMNNRIKLLVAKYHVGLIDLNPELAPGHRLLPVFTVDGVHLSEAGYKVWTEKIQSFLHR